MGGLCVRTARRHRRLVETMDFQAGIRGRSEISELKGKEDTCYRSLS